MASGVIRSSTGTNLEIRIDWTGTAHTASNSSTVRCDVYLEHYSLYSSGLTGSYVKIGSATYSFTAAVNQAQNTKTATKIASFSTDVAHSSDGTASVEISAGWVFRGSYGGVSIDTLSASQTVTLDKITRASSVTFDRTSVAAGGELGMKITRYDSSFRHKLELEVGSAYIYSSFLSGSSPTWTVPASLATGLKNAVTGSAAATLHTYDSSGAWIASRSAGTLTFRIPDNDTFRPSFSFSASVSSSKSELEKNGIYACGISQAKLAATGAAAKYGATLKSCTVKWGGRSLSDNGERSAYSFLCSQETAGEVTFTLTLTDSRGLSASKSAALTFQPYAAPSLKNVTVYRCDADGVPSDSGERIFVSARGCVSALSGGDFTNLAVLGVKIKAHATGASVFEGSLTDGVGAVLGTGLSPFATYDTEISVSDSLGESGGYLVTVPTSRVDFHLRDGAARFGGYCERAGFECDWDAEFGGAVTLGGVPVADFVCDCGTDGIWTWRKWKSGISECFGTTEKKSYKLTNTFGSGLYISAATEANKNSVAFPPGLFVEAPSVTATPAYKEYTYYLSPRNNTTASASADYYISGESATLDYNASFSLHALGRWK